MSCNLVECSKRGTIKGALKFKGGERSHQVEGITRNGFMTEHCESDICGCMEIEPGGGRGQNRESEDLLGVF